MVGGSNPNASDPSGCNQGQSRRRSIAFCKNKKVDTSKKNRSRKIGVVDHNDDDASKECRDVQRV
jgi:hypothetical protein